MRDPGAFNETYAFQLLIEKASRASTRRGQKLYRYPYCYAVAALMTQRE